MGLGTLKIRLLKLCKEARLLSLKHWTPSLFVCPLYPSRDEKWIKASARRPLENLEPLPRMLEWDYLQDFIDCTIKFLQSFFLMTVISSSPLLFGCLCYLAGYECQILKQIITRQFSFYGTAKSTLKMYFNLVSLRNRKH